MRRDTTQLKLFIFVSLLLSLLIIADPISAQEYNETVDTLNQARTDLSEMIDAGFSVLRVQDTLREAEQFFEAQSALLRSGGAPDFSLIFERTAAITELRRDAEEINDQLQALNKSLSGVITESETHALYEKARQEFSDERYDKADELIEEAYTKISEEQALRTRVRAIYDASTKTVLNFLKRIWKEFTLGFAIISLIYLFTRKRIAIFFVNKKIKSLNFEKGVLEKLIKKTQYEYFHLFKISEELYGIRIEKFGELIRDIDRQTPQLMEEKERLRGNEEEKEAAGATSHKNLIVVSAISLLVIVGGIFLAIKLRIAPYTKTVSFIHEVVKNSNSIRFLVEWVEGIPLIILGGVVLIVLLVGVYLKKRSRQTKQKGPADQQPEVSEKNPEKLGLKEKFKVLKSLYLFLEQKIRGIDSYLKSMIKKIKDVRRYRKLLQQKKEEEKIRRRYVRKQRILLFRQKISGGIHTLFTFSFSKTRSESQDNTERKKLGRGKKISKWLVAVILFLLIAAVLYLFMHFNFIPYTEIIEYLNALISHATRSLDSIMENIHN